MSRFKSVCRGLIGLITLTATTVGLPIALYELGGSPIPARLPSVHQVTFTLLHQDNGSLFFGAVRDVSWLAWLAFAIAVVAEIQAAVRGRRAPRLRLAGLQGVAGRLVALAALTFTTPAAVTLASSAAMAATVQPISPAIHHNPAHVAPARVVVVQRGDCLWTIAEHYLGAGDRYTEIVQLNLGHQMGGGEVFSDPALIMAGWHLQLPAVGGGTGFRASRARLGRAWRLWLGRTWRLWLGRARRQRLGRAWRGRWPAPRRPSLWSQQIQPSPSRCRAVRAPG